MGSSLGASGIMTSGEVAGYLKVTERTIYRLTAARKISAFTVGGGWRFLKADMDQWIQQQPEDALRGGTDA